MNYQCPDCSPDGGDGARCPEHEIEYLQMINTNNNRRLREITKARNQFERKQDEHIAN